MRWPTPACTRDIDAVFTSGRNTANDVPEYLGMRPRFIGGTQVGGCSLHPARRARAMAAINAGLCEVALITHGESGASRIAMPAPRWGDDSTNTQFELVHGSSGPPTGYGMLATRHMHEFGTSKEQMAEVAVATRKWAALNPKAFARDPITIDDVLRSRMIAWPFNLLDCCLVTDAGGACIVTSAERARDLPKPPVYVLGTGNALPTKWSARCRHSPAGTPPSPPASAPSAWPASATPRSMWRESRPMPSPSYRFSPSRRSWFLQGRRRRSVRGRTAHRAERGISDEHQRRRTLVHPYRDVRHLHDHRGDPPTARRMRAAPGPRRNRRDLPRQPAGLERRGDA
jgi:hypothetical protein